MIAFILRITAHPGQRDSLEALTNALVSNGTGRNWAS